MRIKNTELHARVNGNLHVRFTGRGLTSYAGVELFRRFLCNTNFTVRVRKYLWGLKVGGDYSPVSMIRLHMVMLLVGASRLRHVGHLVGDPVIQRFCSLKKLPSSRTLSRWLTCCNANIRTGLLALNAALISEVVRPLSLRRLTVDIDGTVISTGLKAERAFRGFNPHQRKVPSYYPITAHLAQTGHILRVKNRSGNVHDGKASPPFLREVFTQLEELDPRARIEMRLDGAFFRKEIISMLGRRAEYAMRAPFYQWVGLKKLVQSCEQWTRIREGLCGFFADVRIEAWKRTVRVAIFRKHTTHKSPKNYQLDLFDPSDGHWEYSAIATNKAVGLEELWDFLAGRGCHERVLADLKGGYAFDTVPTRNYAANSTWQIVSVLTHNLVTNFQIKMGASKRGETAKRSPRFSLKRIRSLRYEMLNRAGIVQRPEGRATLTLADNLPTRRVFEELQEKLSRAA